MASEEVEVGVLTPLSGVGVDTLLVATSVEGEEEIAGEATTEGTIVVGVVVVAATTAGAGGGVAT